MTPNGQYGAGAPYAGAMGSDVSWDVVPEAPVDAASFFDPSLAAIPKVKIPTPVMGLASAEMPQQPAPEANDEERAWLEAVAKAKSQTSEQEPVCAASAEVEESEEDWEALMAAARERAEAEASPVSRVLAEARVRAKSAPPVAPAPSPMFAVPMQMERPPDAASAQVELGAVAANDDRTAVRLTALPAGALAPTAEEEEWQRLRAEVEAKDRAESERKLRAMREIRRLRGNRGNTGNVPTTAPVARRFAAGTSGPPVKADGKGRNLAMAPGPVPSKRSAGATTTRSLPRITQRLNNGS